MANTLTVLASKALEVLFPCRCLICGEKTSQDILCCRCRRKIQFISPPLCRVCSKHINYSGSLCGECRKINAPYQYLISAAWYQEPLKTLIHLFKYQHYDYLAPFLSSLILTHLNKIGFRLEGYEFIIPVPIQPLHLREREYNQTKLLAEQISKSLHIPVRDDIIYCKNHRLPQTTLKKQARADNIRGAFSVREKLKDKPVILVDDIVTTKSTVTECSRMLKENGAAKITVLTVAKTP